MSAIGRGQPPHYPPAASAPVRRAFVLGAGLGKRLRPLTDELPKPLVPVFQKRLVTFAFDHLRSVGIREIIVNTHHAAWRWASLFPQKMYYGTGLTFIHEPILLETGGGIRNIATLLGDEMFYVYNGDTITDLPLEKLAEEQARTKADVVLALRSCGGPLRVSLDQASGAILDLAGLAGSGVEARYLFSGQYLATPLLHEFLQPGQPESVIAALVRMIRRGCRVQGVVCDEGNWFDLGQRAAYLEAHRRLLVDDRFPRHKFSGQEWRQKIHPSAIVAENAHLEGMVIIGQEAKIGPGSCLKNSIIFPGARVGSGCMLENCIVGEERVVRDAGHFKNHDF